MAFAIMFTLIHVNLSCTYVNEFLSMVLDILHLKTIHFHCSFQLHVHSRKGKKEYNDITHCLLLIFHDCALEMIALLYTFFTDFALFQKTGSGYIKGEGLKRSLKSTEPFDVLMTDSVRGNLLAFRSYLVAL
jgi:hypothetical protein